MTEMMATAKCVGRISDSVIRHFSFRGGGLRLRLIRPTSNYGLRHLRAQQNLLNRINLIWAVQSHLQKHFRSSPKQITSLVAPSRSSKGRLAIVTNAGRDAVDVIGAFDE
jgi:hypothetical protein